MRSFLTMAILGILVAVLPACSKKTCGSIADECDFPNSLEDACIDDYKSGGDCRDALKDLRDCVEDEGCGYYDYGCIDEFQDAYDECHKIADWIDEH